jgi:hypothetical protein
MQLIEVHKLSEFPEEIKDFFFKCVNVISTADMWDVQDYIRWELDTPISDLTVAEQEAYYEVRRFLLADLPKGFKKPRYALISQYE